MTRSSRLVVQTGISLETHMNSVRSAQDAVTALQQMKSQLMTILNQNISQGKVGRNSPEAVIWSSLLGNQFSSQGNRVLYKAVLSESLIKSLVKNADGN